jgi:methionyl aminopeptidase
MYTKVKTAKEIEAMRIGGAMLDQILADLMQCDLQGMSTKEIADIAAREIKVLGGKASFLGYQGFPDVICISVNDEVVHGIPRLDKIIQSGDIVSLDLGITYGGMIVDGARSVIAGKADPTLTKLLKVTEESLRAGLVPLRDGCKTGDIGAAVQAILDKGRYGIVRDLVGHGVGHYVHEEPNVPNYGRKGSGDRLRAGMTVAVEPMSTLGKDGVTLDSDGWTIRTADGSLAAHFEDTVLITESGYEILTTR